VNTKLEILAELLADVVEQFQTLLDKVLTDHLEDLALLERLARDVDAHHSWSFH